MDHQAEMKKIVMRVVIWAVVIIALLATVHILVNSFDALEFFRRLHGG